MCLLVAIALRIFFNLGWLTLLCYAIALHVCQIALNITPALYIKIAVPEYFYNQIFVN
jgi:hypothetical protein